MSTRGIILCSASEETLNKSVSEETPNNSVSEAISNNIGNSTMLNCYECELI